MHHAVRRPAGKRNLCNEAGLDPGDVLSLARGILAAERTLAGCAFGKLLEERAGIAPIEAGPRPAAWAEVIPAMAPDQEGAQLAGATARAPDALHLTAPAFHFFPCDRKS